jgi:hypothetical protein
MSQLEAVPTVDTTNREGGMTCIPYERDVAFDPGLEGVVHAQLLLTHLALGDELEHAHDERAKVRVHLQHRALVRPCCPRCRRLLGKIDIGLGGGDVENGVT